jgi:hypothetical protein
MRQEKEGEGSGRWREIVEERERERETEKSFCKLIYCDQKCFPKFVKNY